MPDQSIRDLLSRRECLQARVRSAQLLITALDTIGNNHALLTSNLVGNLAYGRVQIDRHLGAEIAASHQADMQDELDKLDAKIEAINTLLEG